MKKIFNEEQIEFMKQHYKDMSYKEIADYLHLTIGTVKSRIFYSRKKLMNQLSEYCPN